MSLLTDAGIKSARRRRDIVIHPYANGAIAPVGYYIHVGGWVADLTVGTLLQPVEGSNPKRYRVPAGHRVLILTKEIIGVSRHVGGTFHTLVDMVARGWSPISTTLDPGWLGALWVTVTNTNRGDDHDTHAGDLELTEGQRLTKLVFYRARKPALKRKPSNTTTTESGAGALTDIQRLEKLILDLAGEKIWKQTLSDAFKEARQSAEEQLRDMRTAEQELKLGRRYRRLQLFGSATIAAIEIFLAILLLKATSEADRLTILTIMAAGVFPALVVLLQPWSLIRPRYYSKLQEGRTGGR